MQDLNQNSADSSPNVAYTPVRDPGAPNMKCRVLVIDDSPDMLRLLTAYLSDPKIQVTIARNGIEGLAAYRDNVFDLVLMDMEMPEMNGYAATISIRDWERDLQLPRTPIAALTAENNFTASNRMLLAGCTLHLTKPIMRQTLLQIVKQFASK